MSYSYHPEEIAGYGKDRMRFELGDTMVEGCAATCALQDEEYTALLELPIKTKREWKKAKLRCLESIFRRFSYEVDTKSGPLSLNLSQRAKLWQEEYEKLKNDMKISAASPEAIRMLGAGQANKKPPYFYTGMMSREESEGKDI